MSLAPVAPVAGPEVYSKAINLILTAQHSLDRKLSDGERRDLLMDNTIWDSDFIASMVAYIGAADLAVNWCNL